jgi:hypothetical protein
MFLKRYELFASEQACITWLLGLLLGVTDRDPLLIAVTSCALRKNIVRDKREIILCPAHESFFFMS